VDESTQVTRRSATAAGQRECATRHVSKFVLCRLRFDIAYVRAKFDDSSISRSRNYHWGRQNLKWVTWPWPRPF